MDRWTGEIVAELHVNKITQKELAEKLGVTDVYVSNVLNGRMHSSNIEERMFSAIEEIKKERAS